MSGSINPQGYKYGIDPVNVNPFWGDDEGGGGGVFVPHIDDIVGGYHLSWTNDAGLPNPDPVNIMNGEPGSPGAPGSPGTDGITYTPHISEVTDGYVLSWTNDGDVENPPAVTITNGHDGASWGSNTDAGGHMNAPAVVYEHQSARLFTFSATGIQDTTPIQLDVTNSDILDYAYGVIYNGGTENDMLNVNGSTDFKVQLFSPGYCIHYDRDEQKYRITGRGYGETYLPIYCTLGIGFYTTPQDTGSDIFYLECTAEEIELSGYGSNGCKISGITIKNSQGLIPGKCASGKNAFLLCDAVPFHFVIDSTAPLLALSEVHYI